MFKSGTLFFFISLGCYYAYQWYLQQLSVTPFEKNKQLPSPYHPNKWGTLRSGHYLGLSTMSPESTLAGLMWFRQALEHNNVPLRHWCNQGDNLRTYTWLKHDFDNFGQQILIDQNIAIKTHVLQRGDESWIVRVNFTNQHNIKTPVSMVWYFVAQKSDETLILKKQDKGYFVTINSSSNSKYTARISPIESENVIDYSSYTSAEKPPLAALHDVVRNNLYAVRNDEMPNKFVIAFNEEFSGLGKSARFVAVQVTGLTPFAVEIGYGPKNGPPDSMKTPFEVQLSDYEQKFDETFEKTFHLTEKGFNSSQIDFAKAALSNMLGSIGYFYGSAFIQSEHHKMPVRYGPFGLLTAVPSRSFFPRGFLWDEGFHNLLISKVRPDITVSILRSWLNLINSDGWIPREVILGEEAEARVPAEFIVQRNTNANPPTLFLTLESLYMSNSLTKETIAEIYSRLHLWFQWFNKTQTGVVPGTYRWRGRDEETKLELNPKTLTSGLDDYPRATHPTTEERHVDLRCWMAMASRVMAKLSKEIQHPLFEHYEATAQYLSRNDLLDSLHWSEETGSYADYGLHALSVRLVKLKSNSKNPEPPPQKQRKVVDKPSYRFVSEIGYVSLFPFMLNIIDPQNPKLRKVLNDIKNPKLLWTPYGLRSLSLSSKYYQKHNTEHDPPYWRGAIWINMNFLILRALKTYSTTKGPYQSEAGHLYTELRDNLIRNIHVQYLKTGYIWEQYDDSTGKGKGSHPFTGWSALITLIMSENF